MLKKLLAVSIVAILAAVMSGCVVVGAGVGYAVSEGEADKLSGVVEVGDVKTKHGINMALLKTAKLSSLVFNEDMATPNISPRQNDTKVNTTVTEGIRRSLDTTGDAASQAIIRLKTFYYEASITGFYYYGGVTERDTLTYWQKNGVRKAVNTHFTLEQGGDTLLEVHGLWVAGNQGDEIAGARKLAREMVSEVLKKLSTASAPPRESIAEAGAKKE